METNSNCRIDWTLAGLIALAGVCAVLFVGSL